MTNAGDPLPPPTLDSIGVGGGGEREPPWWRRWYTIVAAGVALLLAAAGIVLVAGGGDDTAEQSGATSPTTSGPESTEAPVPTSPTTSPLPTTAPTPGTAVPTTGAATTTDATSTTPPTVTDEPTCRYRGTDSFGEMQVELSFVNTLGDLPSLEVSYALSDGDGTRFLTSSTSVDLPATDEAFRVGADTFEPVPEGLDESDIDCAVLELAEGVAFADTSPPGPGDSCTFLEVDDFDDIQIELTATSPFEDAVDLEIVYALRGPGSVRFQSGSSFVDLVAPGETVRVSEDTITEVPDWMDEREITCEVLGIAALGA